MTEESKLQNLMEDAEIEIDGLFSDASICTADQITATNLRDVSVTSFTWFGRNSNPDVEFNDEDFDVDLEIYGDRLDSDHYIINRTEFADLQQDVNRAVAERVEQAYDAGLAKGRESFGLPDRQFTLLQAVVGRLITDALRNKVIMGLNESCTGPCTVHEAELAKQVLAGMREWKENSAVDEQFRKAVYEGQSPDADVDRDAVETLDDAVQRAAIELTDAAEIAEQS